MLIKLLEDAKTSQMSTFLNSSKEIKGSLYLTTNVSIECFKTLNELFE